jgi:hypothetical protein
MLLFKDKKLLGNFSEISQLEWLETNGLGGWSGSSLSGCNTRRYHGLLMASIHPPAERMLLVSKLDEYFQRDINGSFLLKKTSSRNGSLRLKESGSVKPLLW